MVFIKKIMVPWEIKYGSIFLGGKDYVKNKRILDDYFGTTFELETFKGNYPNRHFYHNPSNKFIRLSCKQFFNQLKDGSILYLQPINKNRIKITNVEPEKVIVRSSEDTEEFILPELSASEEEKLKKLIIEGKSYSFSEIITFLLSMLEENINLREENQKMIEYKEKYEKYQSLEHIFEDEKFMEDWLERNIHKVLPNLEIIDRQITLTWKDKFMRNRPDFLCLDKTTRELVIVENKVRKRFKRIETQYMTYTAWVKNHLEEINEKYKENNLKATENFRFVIITDSTDDRLETICETYSIPLIMIEGGVAFQEIVPYYFE